MAKERRPRVPEELAERIDAVRKDIPFERWVRRALEQALGIAVDVPEQRRMKAAQEGNQLSQKGAKAAEPPKPRVQRGSPSPSLKRFGG